MNWQAVHFFQQPGGLSRNEPKEMAACLDYEQALESKAIVELICLLPPAEKEWMLDRALRLPSRFTFLRSGSDHASRNLRAFEEVAKFPQFLRHALRRHGSLSTGWKRPLWRESRWSRK